MTSRAYQERVAVCDLVEPMGIKRRGVHQAFY
jgi:hypothetical protein